MKARWIGEGDGRKLVGRNEAEAKKGKGATKIKPKKRNNNNISKGVDEKKTMLKWMTEEKKQEKMANREWF